MTARNYSSVAAETTLSGGITNVATSMTVGSTSGWPISYPFTLIIDSDTVNEEVVTVSGVAALVVTLSERGADGTTAVAHNAAATVKHGFSARDFAEPQAHINAASNVHALGVGNTVVGTGNVQVLTNKTLTSPVITGATIDGVNPTTALATKAQVTAKGTSQSTSAIVTSSFSTVLTSAVTVTATGCVQVMCIWPAWLWTTSDLDISVAITRNGTTIATWENKYAVAYQGNAGAGSLSFLDEPGAGTHTYLMRARGQGPAGTISISGATAAPIRLDLIVFDNATVS